MITDEKEQAMGCTNTHVMAGQEPILATTPVRDNSTVPGLVRVIIHARAEYMRLPIAAEPQARCRNFSVDVYHMSGFYQFLDIPGLPDKFYKQGPKQTGSLPILLHDHLEAILARRTEVPIKYIIILNINTNLATAPWNFDERDLGNMVVVLTSRMAMLQQVLEWKPLGSVAQSAHTFIALLQEFANAFPSRDTIDWIGCPRLPDQVVEEVQLGNSAIDKSRLPSDESGTIQCAIIKTVTDGKGK